MMNRRDFVRLGAAFGAGAALGWPGDARARRLPSRTRSTRHLVTLLLGWDCDCSRSLETLAAKGALFAGNARLPTTVPGYAHSTLLTGREERSQRPAHPTWNEILRRKTGESASKYWMLQSASYHGACCWDVKNYSQHSDYGARYGATSFTMNKLFPLIGRRSAEEIVELNVERALGHSREERRELVSFVGDVIADGAGRMEPPGGFEHLDTSVADCRSLELTSRILSRFRPRCATLQLLDLAGGERHIERLWSRIQADPSLQDSTALVIRPSSDVWTIALGPDFAPGQVVDKPIEAHDLAPTLTYLMTD